MLIDKISEEEMNMITAYRETYAYRDEDNASGIFVSSPEVLRVWEDAKEEYLGKLFNNELTMTKELVYEKGETELEYEVEDLIDGRTTYGRLQRSSRVFVDALYDLCDSSEFRNKYDFDTRYNLKSLLSVDNLINNHYDGDPFALETPNGKPYKVSTGQKVMKVLAKVAEIFNLPGFEDFRICHSQILNQKHLTGKLTLSIHPLDYMTMSDNVSDWDSCMSWSNGGSYRQGTVEMMNSKCVIVAYLADEEHDMQMPPYCASKKYYWNNKKWRQLFIVDKNALLAVKDYPYNNADLSRIVLEWIKELAAEQLGWTYPKQVEYEVKAGPLTMENGTKFNFSFLTGSMYNDFGTLPKHWVAYNPDGIKKNMKRRFTSLYYSIPYSGFSQCMICGSAGNSFEDDGCLACVNCENSPCCECCGERFNSADLIQLGDRMLCESCYEDNAVYCEDCGEPIYMGDTDSLYVAFRLDETNAEAVRRHLEQHKPIWGYSYGQERLLKETPPEQIIPFIVDSDPSFYFCDSYHRKRWLEIALKQGGMHTIDISPYKTREVIYWQDLTEELQEEYRWGITDENYMFEQAFGSPAFDRLWAKERT